MARPTEVQRNRKKPAAADASRVPIDSREALRAWLEANHRTSRGAWLVTKRRVAGGTVAWNDIVEELLCFGWIDSLPRKLDSTRTMLLVTPRRPTSKWSAKNKAHVAALVRRGLMTPAGKAAVEVARTNGMWVALDAASSLKVPADLTAELEQVPMARKHWDQFPPSTRRGILEWLDTAKKPETRRRRVEEIARLASENVRANQWRPKKR